MRHEKCLDHFFHPFFRLKTIFMVHVLSPNFLCLSQVKRLQAPLMSPESNFPGREDLPGRIVTLIVIPTAHTLQKQIEKTASELLQALQNQKLKSQNWYLKTQLQKKINI